MTLLGRGPEPSGRMSVRRGAGQADAEAGAIVRMTAVLSQGTRLWPTSGPNVPATAPHGSAEDPFPIGRKPCL